MQLCLKPRVSVHRSIMISGSRDEDLNSIPIVENERVYDLDRWSYS